MFSGPSANCRRRGNRVAPWFPADGRFAELAAGILDIRAGAVAAASTRGASDEAVNVFRQGLTPSESMIASGLDKILTAAMDWKSSAGAADLPDLREKIFKEAVNWRKAAKGDYNRFLALRKAAGEYKLLNGAPCYGDLPESDIAAGMGRAAEWDTGTFIQLYRLEAFRSILLGAGRIKLEITAENAQQLRRLLCRMRFHRLLGRVVEKKGGDKGKIQIIMEISGPADIFGENRKYGINLACFFPSVTLMPEWQMECCVKYREQICSFALDRESAALGNIARKSAAGGAYEPEEFRMFRTNFQQRSPDGWTIDEDIKLFTMPDGALVVPDFVFRRKDEVAALELFHRWHASALIARLTWLEKNPEIPLIIGIDRRILPANGTFEDFAGRYPALENRMFLYRDYPGAATAGKILTNAFCKK